MSAYFKKQRQEWIAARTVPFNRYDICQYFDVSVPTASKDIQNFINNNPNRILYNHRTKIYEPVLISHEQDVNSDYWYEIYYWNGKCYAEPPYFERECATFSTLEKAKSFYYDLITEHPQTDARIVKINFSFID